MKPTEKTLKEEIVNRIKLLDEKMEFEKTQPKDENNVFWFFANDHSIHCEILKCIEYFENIDNVKNFEESKYTPIKCSKTGVLLKIGDKVEKEEHGNKMCGTLYWDEHFNEYLVKSGESGHFRFRYLNKIEKLYDYHIDTTGVECRRGRG